MAVHLLNLDSTDYEHPFDREALKKLKGLSFFESTMKTIIDYSVVKSEYVIRKASNFHVTHESCPEVAAMVEDIMKTLDVFDEPKVYLERNYEFNAYTTGYKDSTMLVVNTSVLDFLSTDEQRYIIGHEFGHIKSKHVMYHVMASYLADKLRNLPFMANATGVVAMALFHWSRMSEYTADRAGLLACQNLDAALSCIVKMSGLPRASYDSINIDAYIREAEELQKDLSLSDKIFEKAINLFYNDHPWNVLRAYELKKWVESGEYDEILERYRSNVCPVCGGAVAKGNRECPRCFHTW